MSRLSSTVLAVVGAFVSAAAVAQTYVFDTVTSYQISFTSTSSVTGLEVNASTPSTLNLNSGALSCLPLILAMMEKSGKYNLTFNTNTDGNFANSHADSSELSKSSTWRI